MVAAIGDSGTLIELVAEDSRGSTSILHTQSTLVHDDANGDHSPPTSEHSSQPQSLKRKCWDLWLTTFCCVEHEVDDFAQTMRKCSAALQFLLVWPTLLSVGCYFVVEWVENAKANDENSAMGNKVLTVTLLLWAVWNCWLHLLVRCISNHVSTALADLNIFGHSVMCFVATLVWPDAAINTLTVALSLLAILTQTRFAFFHCIMSGLIFCFDSYNKAFRHTDYELLLPDARDSSFLERVVCVVGGGMMIAVGIVGVSAQSIVHTKHVSAAKAAVNVCHQIVNLLRRYDTEGVTKALAEHKDVDPELISSLKLINNNLESYRPFLPNYLFQNDSDVDDEETISNSSKPKKLDVFSDDEGSLSLSASIAASSVSDHGSTTTLDSSIHSYQHEDLHRRKSGGTLKKKPSKESSASTVAATKKAVVEVPISFALVEIPSDLQGARAASAVSQFVETIYAAADLSKASVHTLTGGVAMISWNATHRVPQPEMKATRFLNHLKKNQAVFGLKFGAVVFSGPATCYSITTSGKQHACVIAAPWMPMATEAFALACRHKVMLIDQKTEAVSTSNFESMFVDRVALCDKVDNVPTFEQHAMLSETAALFLAPLSASVYSQWRQQKQPRESLLELQRITSLFQLVREVDLNDEEWMYQLEMKEQSENHGKRLEEAALDVFELMMRDILPAQQAPSLSELEANAKTVCGVIREVNGTLPAQRGEELVDGDEVSILSASSSCAFPSISSLIRRLEHHLRSISSKGSQ